MTAALAHHAERFWSHVEGGDVTTCWLWTLGTDRRGYGRFWVEGRGMRAHRFAYEYMVAEIPAGLQLDHLCRNPPCVNPSHLEPVTAAENTARSEAVTAMNARKTHCKRGHEFTPENTRVVYNAYNNGRGCKTCDNFRLWRTS